MEADLEVHLPAFLAPGSELLGLLCERPTDPHAQGAEELVREPRVRDPVAAGADLARGEVGEHVALQGFEQRDGGRVGDGGGGDAPAPLASTAALPTATPRAAGSLPAAPGSPTAVDLPSETVEVEAGEIARAQPAADHLARAAAREPWTGAATRRCLASLAGTHGEFSAAANGSALTLQSRTRRLALGLARLLAPLQTEAQAAACPEAVAAWSRAKTELEAVFAAVDAAAAFDPAAFSTRLARFEVALGAAEAANGGAAAR